MRLFIAEKPELAKAIVEALGGGHRKDGYFDCGADRVTWCFGHMLELCEPHEYDEKYKKWTMEDLPWSCSNWKRRPIAKSKDQLKAILGQLKEASAVVHAGDPDEEGQLLVDEVLEHARWKGPTQRVLINDLNTKLVQRAIASMKDNSEFRGLSESAEARSKADMLYGINLTRTYTLAGQALGNQGVLSVGRVQTPILGLVVRRDRAHSSHKKAYYYAVTGTFQTGSLTLSAAYQPTDADATDDKGRLSSQDDAEAIAQAVSGKPGKLVTATHRNKSAPPPLPYNLLKLQMDASRKFGYSPDRVKDITQSLREKHRLITYNRSDCQYLSDEQHDDAAGVLAAISATAPMLTKAAKRADPAVKSRAFNSKKVSAHHAIIPTETTADLAKLTDQEQKIYLLIARSYIAQFWPQKEYTESLLTFRVVGNDFKTKATVVTNAGWEALYKNDKGNEELESDDSEGDQEADARALQSDSDATCTAAKADRRETKPPALYTMASLLSDLTRVAKYVKDPRLAEILKSKDAMKAGEHGGIGTPATRDTMIKDLIGRGHLVEKGKNIVSSETAKSFYDALPDQAKYPDMTALWHEEQRQIQAGKQSIDAFLEEINDYLEGEVLRVKQEGLPGLKVDAPQCPECGRSLAKRPGRNGPFWGCTGYSEGTCKATYPDKKGKPDTTPKEKPKPSRLHKCMDCNSGLIRRKSTGGNKSKKGRSSKGTSYFWGCSGFPECRTTYPDVDGKPNYERSKETK